MSLLLAVARGAAITNVILLGSLLYVWGDNYRTHRATHTLGLLVFASVFVVQNLLWLSLYGFETTFINWFETNGIGIQASLTGLCGLQSLALGFLAWITWR